MVLLEHPGDFFDFLYSLHNVVGYIYYIIMKNLLLHSTHACTVSQVKDYPLLGQLGDIYTGDSS